MRETIRQALRELRDSFGDAVFTDARKFRNALADILPGYANEPVRNLLNTAIGGMNTYTRIKGSTAGNMGVDVSNLAKEMSRNYLAGEAVDKATVIVECFAELLGYVPHVSSGRNQTPSPPQSPVPAQAAPPQADDGVAQTLAALQKQVADLQQKISQPSPPQPATAPPPPIAYPPPGYYPPPATPPLPSKVVEVKIAPAPAPPPSPPQIGSIYQFGGFDWRVLDVQNNRALLLSDKVPEQMIYHSAPIKITWENCDLRDYLNLTYYNTFASSEQSRIVPTRLKNNDNLWYNTRGGSDTEDKIFLLSLEEADKYFGDSKDYVNKMRREVRNKEVVTSNGLFLLNNHDSSRATTYDGRLFRWWLRSPGVNNRYVTFVSSSGGVHVRGVRVDSSDSVGVRPALWLNL